MVGFHVCSRGLGSFAMSTYPLAHQKTMFEEKVTTPRTLFEKESMSCGSIHHRAKGRETMQTKGNVGSMRGARRS